MKLRLLAALSLPAAVLAQAATETPAPLETKLAALEAATRSAQSAGDNAWMLVCAALVLMMTGPGLALFYGGLVRKKNVLGAMMQSFILMALVTVLWGKPIPLGMLDGHTGQVLNQAIGVGVAWALAIVGTLIILKVCDMTVGLRVTGEQEVEGLDLSMHGEEGYILES